ncbi:hypothetical protein YC2023_023807 [Brassica napus]
MWREEGETPSMRDTCLKKPNQFINQCRSRRGLFSSIHILSRPFISSATESYSPAYGRRVRARAGAGGVSSPLSRLPLCSRSSLLSLSRYACSSRFELASPVEASVARSRFKVGVALSPELR